MRDNQDIKSKNNKSGNRIKVGIGIYFFVMTMLVLVVLVVLWVSLYRYQKKVDAKNNVSEEDTLVVAEENTEEASQECFLNYVQNMTVDNLVDAYYINHPEHFDKETDVKDFLNEQIINAVYDCYKDASFNITEPKYTIISGDKRLADFTISSSNGLFMVSNIDILVTGSEEFTANIPDGAKISINGSEVSEEYISTDKELVTVAEYDDELVEPSAVCNVYIEGLIRCPEDEEVIVNMENGGIAKKAIDDIYYEVMVSDDSENIRSKSEAFVKSLLHYYTMGKENAEGNMAACLGHVATGSAAAKVINGSLAGVVWMSADGTASYELETSDVFVMADNCCCVDVSYTQTGESKLYDTGDGTYRVYLLDSGNGYKIVQFAGIK